MSIDMSQFYQVFFEESAEHLADMERMLLEIDVNAPDIEQLNAIFRAAHSIKGGSGTFGFTDMTEVTHVLESLLDRLRKSEMLPRSDMIDAFLEASDVLKEQLNAHVNGGEADSGPADAIIAKLKILAAGKTLGSEDIASSVSSDSASGHYGIFDQDTPSYSAEPAYGLFSDESNHAATESEGFGLFEADQKPEQIQEAYGFFDAMESKQAVEDPGYGLFDNEPPTKSLAKEGPGFGFFEENLPAPKEDPSFGLFVELPQKTEATTSTQAPSTVNKPDPLGRRAADLAPPGSEPPVRRAADKTAASTASAESTTIRVGVDKVDQLINLVGELVITQAMLAQTVGTLDPVLNESLTTSMTQFERNTRDLQEAVMSIRMMPISFVFSRFPRVVRDLAAKLNKQVALVTVGENTELDKSLIEKIADPLTHLVRNSLDHGIESPEKRIAAGKDPKGTITLSAAHQGGNIVIQVKDDGGGLNRERILSKAMERGLHASESMSNSEVFNLIFEPGFSTAEVVTDVSGRGVGMDVVKRNITGLGGSVEIGSEPGWGTTMTVRLPLTLAILDGMSISLAESIYVIPLTFITETLQPLPGDVKSVTGQGYVVQVRGEYLPLIALHEVFNMEPLHKDPCQGVLVLIEADGKKAALLVDSLVGQQQVVIKSLETNYRKIPGISGATIMGDGRVALILDVSVLIRHGHAGMSS